MEEELKKGIYKNTTAILDRYKKIAVKLQKLPSNAALQEFLVFLKGTIAFYDKKYASAIKVNLNESKQQQEPIQGLNKVEQAFGNLEQGFYMQYPNPSYGDDIRQLFMNTNIYFDRLNTLIRRID